MIYTGGDVNWVFDRMNGHCFYCGVRLVRNHYGLIDKKGAWEIGNFIPLSSEGTATRDNLVPACVFCNSVAENLNPWEFDPLRFRRGDENPCNYISCAPVEK